jgi:hypothetical protein
LTRLRNLSFLTLTALLVGSAAPALAADSPVNNAYGEPSSSASLPFSGLDLGLIAAGGLLLLAMGFGLRRATRSSQA